MNSEPKRKRNVIDSDLLPDEVRDATRRLAAFAKMKAEHEKAFKELAKTMLGDATEDSLKNTIKTYCRENRGVEDIQAEEDCVVVKTVLTKSTQSNLTEANVARAIGKAIRDTADIRRDKHRRRLADDYGLDEESADDLLNEIDRIDNVELLKNVGMELRNMQTVTERYAISYDIKK